MDDKTTACLLLREVFLGVIGHTRSGNSFIVNQGFLLAVWSLLALNVILLPNKESCCKVVI